MDDTALVRFWIDVYNQADITEITQAIGLPPSDVVKTGIIHPGGRSQDLWIWHLNSPLPETEPIDRHIQALLDLLLERSSAIQALSGRYDCGIHCHMRYASTETLPWELHLWKPDVQALAKLGLSITFDVFYLPEPSEKA